MIQRDAARTLHQLAPGFPVLAVTSDYSTKLAWFCRLSGIPPEVATVDYGGDRSSARAGFPVNSWRELGSGSE